MATIEAMYFFFRDFEVALNCGGNFANYNKRWDNILWFYAHQYHLIQNRYTSTGHDMVHMPGYIQRSTNPASQSSPEPKGSPQKRQKVSDSQEVAKPASQQPDKVKQMLGETVLLQKETKEVDSLIENVPVVMFYFSMHTCPPCREFTPLLACLYEEMNEDEKKFEVIFFSGDGKLPAYEEYYAEMPWPAVPWKDPRIKAVAKEFGVRGLP